MTTPDKWDPKKLTPEFLKKIIASEFELIANHRKMEQTLYEMMASLCFHAPLARPCGVRKYGLASGCIIEQPTHWLVFDYVDRHRAHAHAMGTLDESSVLPRPIGYMIKTGNKKEIQRGNPDGGFEDLFLAMRGRQVLGEWAASRCVSEICARQ